MWLPLLWLLLFEAFTNATAHSNDDEDVSIEDPGHPQQPFYDSRYDDDDSYYAKDKYKKPTISEDAIFLPHEKYCQYFYAFDGRESYIFRCPSGYRFDSEKLQCLKSKHVSCGKRKKEVGSSEEKHVGVNFKCPKWSGAHAHNHYCHLFYYCQNKKPSLFMCPPGKLFDHKTNTCLPQNRVKCEKRENPYEDDDSEDMSLPDPESKTIYDCPDKAGVYPHTEFCDKYVRCWYGFGELYVCPKGKLFDEDLKRCRSKNSVYCNKRINPYAVKDDEEPTLVDEYPNFHCRTNWGRFPHEQCDQFYQCEGGHARLFKCPDGKKFDSDSSSCKIASEVTCNKETVDEDDDDFVCPAREGVFKDEEDCASFYKCKKGKAQRLQCPEGELFDTDWKSCSDENQVTCGDRPLPGDDEATNEEESIIDENPKYNCEKRHGRFTHKEYCNWFYHCKDGKPSVRSCRNGKYYDSYRRNCYDEVDCGPRKPKPDYEITTPKPREFSCPVKSGKFPDARDCGAYYVCEKYKHKHHQCPKGKLFHDRWLTCSDENIVTCGNRNHPDVDPEDRENKVVDPNPRFECKAKYGQYDHEEYCDWYYNCHDSKATLRECRRGKYYDSYRRKCHHSKDVSCGRRRKPEERENPPTTETIIPTRKPDPEFRCPQPNGKFPHRRDCSKYYDCKKWSHKEHKCPKHKLFDSRRQSCEDDDHVICDERIHPDMDPDEPEDKIVDPNPRFYCKNNYGRFTHDEYCHYYYNCHNKKATVRECRHGRYYDSRRRKCYDSKEVSCEGRKEPDDYTKPEPKFQCPKPEGKYSHEKDCGKYYECRQWRFQIIDCPKRQLFNEISKRCEDEERVTCGKRIHPEDNPEEPEDKTVDPNPKYDCPSSFGRFEHGNCGWYYHCRDRRPSVRECRRGKYYDRYSKKCKSTIDVNCEDRIKPEDYGTLDPRFQCPKPEGKYPHEKDCGKYYECRKWHFQIIDCPKRQLFDERSKRCEDEERVTCGKRIHPEDNPEEPEDKTVDPNPRYDCPSSFGRFEHGNCGWYYHCRDRRPSVRECRRGKYYDRHSRKCKDTFDVNCEDRIKPEDYGTLDPRFQCPKPEGKYPLEKDCGKYYECRKWHFQIIDCPKRKLFNEKSKKCEDEERVTCGKRIHPEDDPEEPEDTVVDPNPDFKCPSSFGRFDHRNCDWYYHCRDRRPSVRECHRGKYYDRHSRKCKKSVDVNCEDRIKPEDRVTYRPDKSTPTEQETSTTTRDEITTTKRPVTMSSTTEKNLPETTTKEINTERTESQETTVESTTKSPVDTKTTDATTVETKKDTIKPEISTKTTEEPTTEFDDNPDKIIERDPNYDCAGDEGNFPHDSYCHHYYSCKNNKVTLRECPEGKYFDIERGYCEDWYMVSCGDRLTPEEIGSTFDEFQSTPYIERRRTTITNERTTTEEPVSEKPKFDCPSDGVYPHERNCGKYYLCVDGVAEEKLCPAKQLYNEEKKTCYEEQETNCGKRIHPNDDPDNPNKIPDKVIDPNPNFNCSVRHGCMSHEIFCKWYYYCHDKRPEVRECAGDQFFDSVRNKCLDWWMVFCDNRTIPEGTPSTPPTTDVTTSSGNTNGRPEGSTDGRVTGPNDGKTTENGKTRSTRGGDQGTGSTPSGQFTGSTEGRPRTGSGRETGSTEDGNENTKSTSSDRVTGPTVGKTTESGRTRSTRGGNQGTGSTPSGRFTGSTEGRPGTDSGRETGSTEDGNQRTKSTSSDRVTGPTDGKTTESGRTRSTRGGNQGTGSTPSGRFTGSTEGRPGTDSGREIGSTEDGNQRTKSTSSDRVTGPTDGKTTESGRTRSTRGGNQGTGTTPSGRFTGSTEGRPGTDSGRETGSTEDDNQRTKSTSSDRVTGPTDGKTTESGRTRSTRGGNQGTGSTPNGRFTGSTEGRPGTDNGRETGSTEDGNQRTKSTSSDRVTGPTDGKTTESGRTRSTRGGNQGTGTTPSGRFTGSTEGRPGTDSGRETGSTEDGNQRTKSTSSDRVTGPTDGKTTESGRTRSTRGGNQGTGSTPSGRFTGSTEGRPGTDSGRETGSTEDDNQRTKSTSSDRVTGPTDGKTTESGKTRSTRGGNQGTGSTPNGRFTGSTEGRPGTDNGRETGSTEDGNQRTKSTSSDRVTGPTDGKTTESGRTRSTRGGNQGTGTTPSGRFTGSTEGRPGTDSGRETGSTEDGNQRTKSTSSDRVTGPTDGKTTESGRTRSTRGGNQGTGSTPSGRFTGSTEGRPGTDSGRETGSTEDDITTRVFTTIKPITDKCKEEDGDFHHPDDCSQYYTCKDGDYSINECPSGMLFDRNLRICEREDRVDCEGRKKPEVITDDCDEWLRTSTVADDNTTKPSKGTTGPIDNGTGGTEATTTSPQNIGSTLNEISVKTDGYTESDLPNSSDSSITNESTNDSEHTESPTTDSVPDSTNSNAVSEDFSDSTTNNDIITETGITGEDITSPNSNPDNTEETGGSKITGEFESTTKQFTDSPVTDISTDSSEKSTVSSGDEGTENTAITKENSSSEPTETNFETEETSKITGVQTDTTDKMISTSDNSKNTESTYTTGTDESQDSTITTVIINKPTVSTTSESGENTDSPNTPTSNNENKETMDPTKDNESEESTITSISTHDPTTSTTESEKNTDSSDTPTSTSDNVENTETTPSTKDNESEESTFKTVTILKPTTSTTSESGENTDSTGRDSSKTPSTDQNKETTSSEIGSTNENLSSSGDETSTKPSGENTDSTGRDSSTSIKTSSTDENQETTTSEVGSTDENLSSSGDETSTKPSEERTNSELTEPTTIPVSEIGTTTSKNKNPVSDTTNDITTEDNETFETKTISERTPAEPELSTVTSTQNTEKVSGSTENPNTDNTRIGHTSSTESEIDVSTINDLKTESNINTDDSTSDGTSPVMTKKNDETTSAQTTSTSNEGISTITETETTEHSTIHPCLTHTHSTALPTEPTNIDCDKDDIDCIERKTGDVEKWYKCPTKEGFYPHPHSNRVFIRCKRWRPQLKRCSRRKIFSAKYRKCVDFH